MALNGTIQLPWSAGSDFVSKLRWEMNLVGIEDVRLSRKIVKSNQARRRRLRSIHKFRSLPATGDRPVRWDGETSFTYGDITVAFDRSTSKITVSVDGPRTQIDDFLLRGANPLWKALVRSLSDVTWTRTSGGTIVNGNGRPIVHFGPNGPEFPTPEWISRTRKSGLHKRRTVVTKKPGYSTIYGA